MNCCRNNDDKIILKRTYRTRDEKRYFEKRLNIIEGQIRGIKQMINDDRYCNDVLIQISAIINSLKSLENNMLEKHLKKCVCEGIKNGNEDIVDEVLNLVKKL